MISTPRAKIRDSLEPGGNCPLSAEARWTLGVLAGAVNRCQSLADSDLKAPVQVEPLLDFTETHALTALLAWHLKKNGQIDQLPAPLVEAFTRSFHASLARACSQLAELTRTLGELEANGIAAIPWKGPLLAHRLFEESAARESCDLDILVAPECLTGAEAILLGLGYSPMEFGSEVRAELNEDHCKAYQHEFLPVTIELHRRPFPHSFPFPLAFEEITLARDSPHLIGGSSFPVMAVESELLLSAAHAAKHLWARLAWIADVARLAEGMSAAEAAALDQLARQSRCHRAVQVSLLLAEDLLHTEVPKPVKDHFAPSPAARRLARTIRERIFDPNTPAEGEAAGFAAWLCTQRLRMDSRESLGDRLHIAGCALSYALKPNANDREFIPGIRLPGGVALLCRPARLLAKYVIRGVKKRDQ